MKSKIATSMLLLGMLLLGGSSLFAQDKYIEVNIPFPFTVMEKSFPEGTYTIKQIDTMELNGYTIRSKDGLLSEDFLTEEMQMMNPAKKATLVFNEVGGQYFLAQFFNSGDETARKLAKSKLELTAEAANPLTKHKVVEGKQIKNMKKKTAVS